MDTQGMNPGAAVDRPGIVGRSDDLEGCPVHPTLHRLDRLADHLADDDDVLAVLGLGSAGEQHGRFDEHSDIDFFVVTRDESATRRYVEDVDWLAPMGDVAYTFLNVPHGGKVLFADGLFAEYAVFTREALASVPFVGGRAVWARRGYDPPTSNQAPSGPPIDTIDFHLGEVLTNLFVGLHREMRGERLSAMRFIQVLAVDRIIDLLRLTGTPVAAGDPFDLSRRMEASFGVDTLPLGRMVPGYDDNVAAARTTLAWLTARFPADPAIVTAIEGLLDCEPPS